jgi:hypothetical protein
MKTPFNDLALLGFDLTGDLGDLTFYTRNDGRAVAYPRASPLNPPTAAQQAQRDKLTDAARDYAQLTQEQRDLWQRAARKASLRITGYNLWVYWYTTGDTTVIQTVAKQTGIDLLSTLPP